MPYIISKTQRQSPQVTLSNLTEKSAAKATTVRGRICFSNESHLQYLSEE